MKIKRKRKCTWYLFAPWSSPVAPSILSTVDDIFDSIWSMKKCISVLKWGIGIKY